MMDIEAEVIAFLRDYLGLKAYAEVPARRPDEFVTVERTGGAYDGVVVDRPTLAIQAWSTSRYQASNIGRLIAESLPFMVEVSGVNNVDINTGPYNWPDPDSGTARYQLVVEFNTTR